MSDLRAALGRVAAGGRLSRVESRGAIAAILDGTEPPAVAAGLLAALAARGETAEEVAGAVDVLRERARRLAVGGEPLDVCGTGGDGLGTFNVSTVTAFVVAGAGVPVAKHGGRAVSSSCGSADVLAAAGVDLEMPPETAARALDEAGVTFLFAPAYHTGMKAVAPLRREMGIRTIFNLAGPLSNPAFVRRQIVGVDRPERLDVVAGALRLLGSERAWVVSHEVAGDELLPFGRTVVVEVTPEGAARREVRPRDFGVAEAPPESLAGGDAETNVRLLRAILDGEPGPRRDTVLMNAAAALVVAGVASSLVDGCGRAAAALDSGAARSALERLVAISRGDA